VDLDQHKIIKPGAHHMTEPHLTSETHEGIYEEQWTCSIPEGSQGAIIHGLGEHSGRYHRSIQQLFKSEDIKSIRLLDFPGHGKSDGKRGDAQSGLLTYIKALESFFKRHADLEWVWGHSMGSLVLFNAFERSQSLHHIQSVILTAPPFEVVQVPNILERIALPILRKIGASITLPTKIQAKQITSVYEEQEIFRKDNLNHSKISVRLYESMLAYAQNYCERLIMLMKQYPKLRIYVAHGRDDNIASVKGCEKLQSCLESSEVSTERLILKVYNNSRHEIHHDQDRDALFKDLLTWLQPTETQRHGRLD
jgi:acylglycerol lipase